jgi:hypothetical protein
MFRAHQIMRTSGLMAPYSSAQCSAPLINPHPAPQGAGTGMAICDWPKGATAVPAGA